MVRMKTTANLATYSPRVTPQCLEKAIDSLIDQVDLIRIYFNDCHPNTDRWQRKYGDKGGRKILAITGGNNLTDNGKFYPLTHFVDEPEIYLTCDDDIAYPPDYVAKTVAAIKEYGCIVSYHGRRLLGVGHNYYKGHTSFRCLDHVQTDEEIDVPGTGVMAFDTRYFHPKGLANCPDLRMADLVFALEAAKQGKQIGVLAHEAGWIKHIPNKETIYETESRNGIKRQNEIADEIYRLRNESNT